MASVRGLLAISCAFGLGACATSIPPGMQTRSACLDEPGGWCPFTQDLAVESYRYAQLSQNAYNGRDDRAPFVLSSDYVRVFASSPEDDGFTYAVYERLEDNLLAETIIAYRGTDSLSDWLHGNISTRRNKQGEQVYQAHRDRMDDAGHYDVPITVTGHSLGGGIASSVSQGRSDVNAYVFNTSPRYQREDEDNPPRRVAISEHGEFLRVARAVFGAGDQTSLRIDCFRAKGPLSSLDEHAMGLLAGCLTWIAARAGDDGAARSLSRNGQITPPDMEPEGSPPPPGWTAKPGADAD